MYIDSEQLTDKWFLQLSRDFPAETGERTVPPAGRLGPQTGWGQGQGRPYRGHGPSTHWSCTRTLTEGSVSCHRNGRASLYTSGPASQIYGTNNQTKKNFLLLFLYSYTAMCTSGRVSMSVSVVQLKFMHRINLHFDQNKFLRLMLYHTRLFQYKYSKPHLNTRKIQS